MKTNEKLENATNKINHNMLDNMDYGETIKLNKRFDLYKYDDEETYFVLIDLFIGEETFCVQYSDNDFVTITDFWGYSDEEWETL